MVEEAGKAGEGGRDDEGGMDQEEMEVLVVRDDGAQVGKAQADVPVVEVVQADRGGVRDPNACDDHWGRNDGHGQRGRSHHL